MSRQQYSASDSKWTKSVVLPSVQQMTVFFTNTSAALNLEFSSILRAENPVKQSMARYVTPRRVSFLLRPQGVRRLLFNEWLREVRRFWSKYYLIPRWACGFTAGMKN